uniref:Uncharacterized protein n=1 Tax=Anguilla anguilla TaxID=7936 RepID=A0A0E9TKD3_ANGAN
MSPCPRNWT